MVIDASQWFCPQDRISQLLFAFSNDNGDSQQITRPIDVRGFGAKVSDQMIVQRLKTQTVLPLSSVTAPAGLPSRCSKDEVPVESQHLAASVWEFRLSRLTMIRSRRCG
jgi:hypothetical protein